MKEKSIIANSMPVFNDRSQNGILDFRADKMFQAWEERHRLVDAGMYAFVSWKWVDPFVYWLGDFKVLEVMAGAGWLSYALREKGVDVIATDNFSWGKKKPTWKRVTKVEKLNCINAVKKYGKDIDVLIMSWPYMDDFAFKTIRELHEINPKAVVVYIGEGHGGCTANDNFFHHWDEIVDDVIFNEIKPHFQRWDGLHDHIELGKYKDRIKSGRV
jgi:hypothetical protein